MHKSSKISGFHKMPLSKRIKIVQEFADLTDDEVALLGQSSTLGMDTAQHLIENVVGTFELPLGIVTNFSVNGRDILVPLAVEESSVVAAMGNAAKMARSGGGFFASTTDPVMIAQIQTLHVNDPFAAKTRILEKKEEIIEFCNEQDPILVGLGGGCLDVEVRVIDSTFGPMVVTHILVDTRDAMGANAVNTMAEALAPRIERWAGGKVFLRILSNLADHRLARAYCTIKKDAITPGPDVIDGIVYASEFADIDPYRAATHNKGIMNGISALVISTGNDFRAIEAGAHAFAAQTGRYRSLSKWEKNGDGDLVGSIELPLAMGLVGGATAIHPMAKIVLKILGVSTASELAEITAAAGLCQNMAALRALASEGIQHGHMSLHAKNVAIAVGAIGEEIEKVTTELIGCGQIRADVAQTLLKKLRKNQ